MFRSELKEKLSQIFTLKKTTFDAPSVNSATGTFEQDTLFVEIDEVKSRAREGRITAEVLGTLTVYSQIDKMPYGYFNKRIQLAENSLTKNFFFFDIDLNNPNSPARVQNIVERRVRFVYLYSGEFDPEHGQLSSIEGI